MSTQKKEVTKVENYTAEMVAKLKAEPQPISFARAEELAKEWGKTARSVVAKIKRENLEYTPKPPATKKPVGVTKKDIVKNIANVLDCDAEKIADLEKASTACLNATLSAIVAVAQIAAEAEDEIFDDENLNDENPEDFNENGTDASENAE